MYFILLKFKLIKSKHNITRLIVSWNVKLFIYFKNRAIPVLIHLDSSPVLIGILRQPMSFLRDSFAYKGTPNIDDPSFYYVIVIELHRIILKSSKNVYSIPYWSLVSKLYNNQVLVTQVGSLVLFHKVFPLWKCILLIKSLSKSNKICPTLLLNFFPKYRITPIHPCTLFLF
jgi:hypothetical protein